MKKIKIALVKLSNVAPGTWVRLALLIAALVNTAVKLLGDGSFSLENEAVERTATVIVMVVTALIAYWKNNSFTQAALAADEVMKSLKN